MKTTLNSSDYIKKLVFHELSDQLAQFMQKNQKASQCTSPNPASN